MIEDFKKSFHVNFPSLVRLLVGVIHGASSTYNSKLSVQPTMFQQRTRGFIMNIGKKKFSENIHVLYHPIYLLPDSTLPVGMRLGLQACSSRLF